MQTKIITRITSKCFQNVSRVSGFENYFNYEVKKSIKFGELSTLFIPVLAHDNFTCWYFFYGCEIWYLRPREVERFEIVSEEKYAR